MHTGNHQEPQPQSNDGWREAGVSGEELVRLQNLLDLVRREHQQMELSPERREQIRERVMARVERNERRRRRWRMFVKGACAVMMAGVVLRLIARARVA